MGIFDGYFDNFINFGGPKGNLGDYQHAARLYVDNNMRLAPKFKHLSKGGRMPPQRWNCIDFHRGNLPEYTRITTF